MSSSLHSPLLLVGAEAIFPREGAAEDRMRFLGDLFPRLTRDVRHTGSISRIVGFQGFAAELDEMEYVGIEVNLVESVPRGMVAWELGPEVFRRRTNQDPRGASAHPIRWIWRDAGPTGERPIGEFAPTREGSGLPARLRLTTNAYLTMLPGGSGDEIELVDYDPSWPERFVHCKRWLESILGPDTALRVEHYGSTAIAGIPAKPIIDILVEIPDFEVAMPRVLPSLNNPLWEYWWYKDHLTFIRRDRLGGTRTHHLHMAPRGHALWQGVAFRDYLRSHPEDASRYAELKRGLARDFSGDRERYSDQKTAFVREIARKAATGSG